MCGITGYFGNFDSQGLRKGIQAMAHRGPDDWGMFVDEEAKVGFGHVRLSILDVSPLGHQPMFSEDGSVALIFNGEIYNFRELRKGLEAKGHKFRGHSDTEVLLQLYLAEGLDLLNRLNGIFAFAIWDNRIKEMFVARDAMGVKPLYYTEGTRGFAFASEIKALLPWALDARQLDAAALHRYLSFLWCPGEATPLRAVRKLCPGEILQISGCKIASRRSWYHLPVFRGLPADLGEQDAVRGTAAMLRRAVHRQMVADVPVGAFLSGGLDSSSVVAFAREAAPKIQCFTMDSRGRQDPGFVDDLPYARMVARHLDVPLNVVRVESSDMASDLEQMVSQLDEPLADPAPLAVLYISRFARELGMKVLLSGAGGDDLYTGYRRHLALNCEFLFDWLPACLRRTLDARSAGWEGGGSFGRRASRLCNGLELDGNERLAHYFFWMREDSLRALYAPDFREEIKSLRAASPLLDFIESLPPAAGKLDRMLALEQRFFLADHNLIYTDKMSMATGVEVRVPFLDRDLVEHAWRIPAKFKQRGLFGKWVLKKAMEPYLPREAIYRPKVGFGAPLSRWLRYELRELTGDLLSESTLRRRGLFEPGAVQKLLTRHQSGKVDAAYTLFALMCTEIWCRKFLDTQPT
ncbi:MAG: asparagine synthase (glutamine-hydrolyzing) [Syntrophobacteraceae bacterium]|nr:asparagine synthase (glutamine-hydrolyzing) [Syntrophobacteraceae bacterium]